MFVDQLISTIHSTVLFIFLQNLPISNPNAPPTVIPMDVQLNPRGIVSIALEIHTRVAVLAADAAAAEARTNIAAATASAATEMNETPSEPGVLSSALLKFVLSAQDSAPPVASATSAVASVVVESAHGAAASAQEFVQDGRPAVTSARSTASEIVSAPPSTAALASVVASSTAKAVVPPVVFFEPHNKAQPVDGEAPLSTSHRTKTMFVANVYLSCCLAPPNPVFVQCRELVKLDKTESLICCLVLYAQILFGRPHGKRCSNCVCPGTLHITRPPAAGHAVGECRLNGNIRSVLFGMHGSQ